MKILITNTTNKVRSRLARQLTRHNDRIRTLVHNSKRTTNLKNTKIELTMNNLLNANSLTTAIVNINTIVHCTTFFRNTTAEQTHTMNDLRTRALTNTARTTSMKHFIFTNTNLVHDSNGNQLADKNDPYAPTTAYPMSKLTAEQFLLALDDLDARVLQLPFVYDENDPHIEKMVPFMRDFPKEQRMSIAHHVDVAQTVAQLLNAPSPQHQIYNVVDDETPNLTTLFATIDATPPNNSNAKRTRTFDPLLDGHQIHAELEFEPQFPRLANALAHGTLTTIQNA